MSKAEETMKLYLDVEKIQYKREYRFHDTRKWRFDFAIPEQKIGIEVEGVLWRGQGRHQRAEGYEKDCEKYNEAALLGWRVLRFTQKQVNNGYAIDTVKRGLECQKEN